MNISQGSKEPTQVLLASIEDNPYQMRTGYDESALTALAISIHEVGLLQVPVARKVGQKFQLAFGHRRKRAFEQLYRTDWAAIVSHTMPLIVLNLTDREMFEISLSENLKREDLSPIDKATALRKYMDEFGATSRQAAQLFGIPEGTIRGTVRLLKLPEESKQKLQSGQISQSQARRILRKPEKDLKRLEPKDGPFNLREKLMILVYDRVRSDVSDELLFKKIREIAEQKKQLERQVEMMNSRKRESAKLGSTRPRIQHVSASNS
jgi:ParB family chromosome partitioning protein